MSDVPASSWGRRRSLTDGSVAARNRGTQTERGSKVRRVGFSTAAPGNVTQMPQRNGRRREAHQGNGRDGEAEKYERAATQALEMLDWCIGYLVGIHKDQIASRLASNRRYIKEHLMREPEEPLPTGDD